MNLKELHEDCIEQMNALCNKIKGSIITLDHGIDFDTFQQLSVQWRRINDTIINIVASLALVAGSEAGYRGGYIIGLQHGEGHEAFDDELKNFFLGKDIESKAKEKLAELEAEDDAADLTDKETDNDDSGNL